jgi:hypothetical protein
MAIISQGRIPRGKTLPLSIAKQRSICLWDRYGPHIFTLFLWEKGSEYSKHGKCTCVEYLSSFKRYKYICKIPLLFQKIHKRDTQDDNHLDKHKIIILFNLNIISMREVSNKVNIYQIKEKIESYLSLCNPEGLHSLLETCTSVSVSDRVTLGNLPL